MKKYTKPYAEFSQFAVEDIITASGTGVVVNVNDLTVEDKNMYDVYSKNSTAQNTNVSVFTW